MRQVSRAGVRARAPTCLYVWKVSRTQARVPKFTGAVDTWNSEKSRYFKESLGKGQGIWTITSHILFRASNASSEHHEQEQE
jgi:hypothetical protein